MLCQTLLRFIRAKEVKNQKSRKIFNPSLLDCPVCGKRGFSIYQIVEDIPYFGEVLETFAHCKFCGYKTYDILLLGKQRYPKKQKVIISSEKDLSKRIVKSKYCSIKIPEINLKISPGSNSEAYISNVEGLLNRTIESLKSIASVKPEKENDIKKEIKKLEKAKSGNFKITILLDDPTGQSSIVSKSLDEKK